MSQWVNESWGMATNVDFDPKWTLFWAHFSQKRADTIFLKKNMNFSHFSPNGCPTFCKVTQKSNGIVMRNGHECWFCPKMDPFLGPFCPNKGKYVFFEKIRIHQILSSMDAQLPAKLQKKVMEQSWGMAMNVNFDPKWTLFWGPFAPIRANAKFLKKYELVRF